MSYLSSAQGNLLDNPEIEITDLRFQLSRYISVYMCIDIFVGCRHTINHENTIV